LYSKPFASNVLSIRGYIEYESASVMLVKSEAWYDFNNAYNRCRMAVPRFAVTAADEQSGILNYKFTT